MLLLCAGCGSAPEPPLRVGINPWPGYAFAFLARDLGYFAQAGLAVRLVEFSSLPDARRAFERGQLDGFFGTPVEALLADARSPHLPRIAAVVDTSTGGDVILARPGISQVSDLRGRRVGLEPDSVNVDVLGVALARAGVRLDEITLVPGPQQGLAALLATDAVDAVVTYSPIRQQLDARFALIPIFDTRALPRTVPDLLMFNPRTPPARVAAFTRAYWQAVAYHAREPADAHARMAGALGVTPREIAAQLAGEIRILAATDQPALLSDPDFLPPILARCAAMLQAIGEIARRYTPAELRALVGPPPAFAAATP